MTMETASHLIMVPASAVPVPIDVRKLLLFLCAHFLRSPAPLLLDGRRYWKLPIDKKFVDGVLAIVSMCLIFRPYFWSPYHGEDESMLLLLLLS